MARREPIARRDDLVEVLHGVEVADPYRWLEDTGTAETRRWIAAQNERTAAWLARIPQREAIRGRLAALWDHPRLGPPWRRGRRWFQLRNDGLQDQDVLWVADEPGGPGRLLLDPNALSAEGTVALTRAAVSADGRLLAYGLSEHGSDWVTWRVRDVATGEDLADAVRWSKFTSAAWLPDASGFLYGAYDPPAAGDEHTGANRAMRLQLHRLGSAQEADEVVVERPDEPEWGFEPVVSDDGRWLVVVIHHGTHPETRIHARRLPDDGGLGDRDRLRPICDDGDARYEPLGTVDDTLYVLTDHEAPRGRVLAVDLTDPAPRRRREVVAEGGDPLEAARIVAGRIVTVELDHARHRVRVRELDGTPAHEVDLPPTATVGQLTGREGDEVVHLSVETFTHPPRIVAHDVTRAATTERHAPGLELDPDRFTVEQTFVGGDDGTEVPLFLVRRADVTPDGDVPTLLWGYGGFDSAVTPAFTPERLVWVERGGLLAVACLRGGGEYGRRWHDAGRLGNKQNVFDDLVACARWLAGDGGWTRPERLAITGRSNGGLLVGAAMTQHPELFGACVPEVGVLDMLRFHRFTIGWAWVSDYGSPDDPEAFGWLLAYSPYHNVRPDVCYPPTLVATGDTDDRVVPGHSLKFAAALQHAQGCSHPILVRVDVAAGHGVGKPTAKLIDERADVLAFLEATVGGSEGP